MTTDAARQPSPLNFAPGEAYADAVRMFQGIPGIERAPNGRLWATWYGGGVTEDRHNYVMLVTSGDDGRTWSGLKLVIDPDRDGPCRAFDPCLWLDPGGRLWLFWAERHRSVQLWAITTENPGDESPTWTEPRHVAEGIMMNKPLVTSQGHWLLPVAMWRRDDSCRVVASTDQGRTWSLRGAASVPDPKDRNCDEHMLVERQDGSLWMLVRTQYGIGESVSDDGGKTWSPVSPSAIQHATARFFIRRLASGKLLLVKHGPIEKRTGRSDLTAYLSDDDGKTWGGGLLLDGGAGVSYPDGVQAPDGRIYTIHDYSRSGAKLILMSVFTEADVAAGKPVTEACRLRGVVNQATGVNPGRRPRKADYTLDPNADGEALLQGPGADVEPLEGEADTFAKGRLLFTDREYALTEVPEELAGKRFVRSSIERIRVVCRKPGVVYIVTPAKRRNRDSLADALGKLGFRKARLAEFVLFPGRANVVTTYQKRVEAGETLTLGKWGVLIH
ncbi:MAG: sialidase family protein [bacterium]